MTDNSIVVKISESPPADITNGLNSSTPHTEDQIQPAGILREQSSESLKSPAHDSSNTSSFISFTSNVSTPFDLILSAHAQSLRNEVDNIKLNICNTLKVDIDQFALVTPSTIKQCGPLQKISLATALLTLLGLAESVCSVVNGRKLEHLAKSDPPSDPSSANATDNAVPPNDSLLAIQRSIIELKRDNVHKETLNSIKDKLNELTESIDQFKHSRPTLHNVSTPDVPGAPPFHVAVPAMNESVIDRKIVEAQACSSEPLSHIEKYCPNFIDQTTSDSIVEFLQGHSAKFDENFERGHGVISFGETYSYPGAKSIVPISKSIPEPLCSLVSIIEKEFPGTVINQCLVNRYLDKTSCLPRHSDNESSICHDSNIFTVSLGGDCDVTFSTISEMTEKSEITQRVEGRSMYVMSKQSQYAWQHRIDPAADERELRYSITFRYVSKNTSNATVILGDSNTRFLRFGSGKGRFGDRLPGKRIECFTVSQIDPSRCVGYRNIFVHCGINDIKGRNSNVERSVSELTDKLCEIRSICPYAKLVVSPILPTKLQWLNEKAVRFNRLLFSFINSNPGLCIGTLDFSGFCDSKSGLLAEELGRYHNADDKIHLGSSGIFQLSRLICDKVFLSPVDGRQFSDVARGAHQHNYKPRPRRSIIQ